MSERISEAEVRRRLKRYVECNYSCQKDFARAHGCSGAYISQALSGRNKIPAKWLALIGVSRLVEVSYYGPDL